MSLTLAFSKGKKSFIEPILVAIRHFIEVDRDYSGHTEHTTVIHALDYVIPGLGWLLAGRWMMALIRWGTALAITQIPTALAANIAIPVPLSLALAVTLFVVITAYNMINDEAFGLLFASMSNRGATIDPSRTSLLAKVVVFVGGALKLWFWVAAPAALVIASYAHASAAERMAEYNTTMAPVIARMNARVTPATPAPAQAESATEWSCQAGAGPGGRAELGIVGQHALCVVRLSDGRVGFQEVATGAPVNPLDWAAGEPDAKTSGAGADAAALIAALKPI